VIFFPYSGHGYIDHELAIEDMMRYHETGFTTWDLADIYGPRTITRSIVNENIEKSLDRMSVNSLDLLQFHWWDYNIKDRNCIMKRDRHLGEIGYHLEAFHRPQAPTADVRSGHFLEFVPSIKAAMCNSPCKQVVHMFRL
jgi:aryl-alcohol dehydrogenase-like predicted oxidoreductase